MTPTPAAIAQELRTIVGAEAVFTPEQLTLTLADALSRLGLSLLPAAVVYPHTQAELAEVLTCAAKNRWRLLPAGQGTKLDWGGLCRGAELVVSTARLDRLIDHAAGDMTVTIEAGMGLAQLQTQLQTLGQFAPLNGAFPEATLGGILASRDGGSLRHRYGSIRDLCLGIHFVRADGQRVKAGGRVVKNVAGYDLMKLLTGSFGTLGIVTELTLRLYPRPEAAQAVLLTGTTPALAEGLRSLLGSTLTPAVVDLCSLALLPGELGVTPSTDAVTNMGILVEFQGLTESVKLQIKQLQNLAVTAGLRAQPVPEGRWQETLSQVWARGGHHSGDNDFEVAEVATAICQVGCLPAQAIATFNTLANQAQRQGTEFRLQFQAGVGSGHLRIEGTPAQLPPLLAAIRTGCEAAGGWLTLLKGPVVLKQQVEVWGYTGAALMVMQKLKQQFDPQQLLSVGRFVGGL